MAAGRLCDFCEILGCYRWVWWGVLSEFAETKNNLSGCNAKSKGDRAIAQRSYVDNHESICGRQGESVWWAWPQPFARCMDLKCCKFLAQLWWLPPGLKSSSHLLHHYYHLD